MGLRIVGCAGALHGVFWIFNGVWRSVWSDPGRFEGPEQRPTAGDAGPLQDHPSHSPQLAARCLVCLLRRAVRAQGTAGCIRVSGDRVHVLCSEGVARRQDKKVKTGFKLATQAVCSKKDQCCILQLCSDMNDMIYSFENRFRYILGRGPSAQPRRGRRKRHSLLPEGSLSEPQRREPTLVRAAFALS